MSSGAKQTIYNLCMAVLDPGDEAIIPAPYWVSYPDMVLLADGLPVMPFAGASQGYKITPRQLAAAITPKTRLVLLNSPCNPTGAAYTRAELRALGEVLLQHPRILIGTDDMYEMIYWAPEPFCSLLTVVPELYGRTVTINGVSKAYAMTGWRIGYCGGPKEIINAMATIQGQSTSNASSITQKAAMAALNGGPGVRREDERGVQGASRFHRRRAQLPAGRELPAGRGNVLRVRGRHRRPWRRSAAAMTASSPSCSSTRAASRWCRARRLRRAGAHSPVLRLQHADAGEGAGSDAPRADGRRGSKERLGGARSSGLLEEAARFEHVPHRREPEVLQQLLHAWLGLIQVVVVPEPGYGTDLHARLFRIELPRVQVERERAAPLLVDLPQAPARHGIRQQPEVAAA